MIIERLSQEHRNIKKLLAIFERELLDLPFFFFSPPPPPPFFFFFFFF